MTKTPKRMPKRELEVITRLLHTELKRESASVIEIGKLLIEAKDDRIILTATDLELGIRCSCPAKVKKEGAGTIPARKLLDYARLLPDADLNMKFLENHWANITSGRSKTRMAGMSRESFPELPSMPAVMAEVPVRTLSSMISRTVFAFDLTGKVQG